MVNLIGTDQAPESHDCRGFACPALGCGTLGGMKRLAPLALLLLTACSAAPAVTVTASPTPGYVCEDASDLGDSILEDTEYISLQAWAVRDPAHAKAYYVAIKLAGDEVDGKVALWATNSLTLPASIRSVDRVAEVVSGWPEGRSEGFTLTDPAAEAAKACID